MYHESVCATITDDQTPHFRPLVIITNNSTVDWLFGCCFVWGQMTDDDDAVDCEDSRVPRMVPLRHPVPVW